VWRFHLSARFIFPILPVSVSLLRWRISLLLDFPLPGESRFPLIFPGGAVQSASLFHILGFHFLFPPPARYTTRMKFFSLPQTFRAHPSGLERPRLWKFRFFLPAAPRATRTADYFFPLGSMDHFFPPPRRKQLSPRKVPCPSCQNPPGSVFPLLVGSSRRNDEWRSIPWKRVSVVFLGDAENRIC